MTPEQKAAAIAANAAWAAEALGRQPKRGVLICDRVLPGSAAALAGVEPGDVLLRVGEDACVDFAALEHIIDNGAPVAWSGKPGKELLFVWARLGVERSTLLTVADLHPLIPRDFVECGASVFHGVSYQRAMRWHIPIDNTGVYLSVAGIFGDVGSGTVVTEMGRGEEVSATTDLSSLFKILKAVPDGVYFNVRYRDWSGNGHGRERSAQVRMDRRLWPLIHWKFEPGLPNRWVVAEDATTTTPLAIPAPDPNAAGEVDYEGEGHIQRALTEVSFFVHTRLVLEGIKPRGINAALFRCRGIGIIIDVERRLLLAARSVVPQLLGNVEVTFRKTLTIEAKPLLIHPELNVVVLQLAFPFPPGVRAVQLGESNELFDSPKEGRFFGLDHRGHPVERECAITADEVWNPPILSPPRTRQGLNCELLCALNDEEINDGLGGVFCLQAGKASSDAAPPTQDAMSPAAIFFEFVYDNAPEYHCMRGLPIALLQATVAQALAGATVFPSLELEVGEMSFAEARKGKRIADEHLHAIAAKRPLRKTVVTVERLLVGGAAVVAGIRPGDLLLQINSEPLSGPADLQRALSQLAGLQVPVQVWRDRSLKVLEAQIASLPAAGIRRLLCWQGMLVARTPRAYEEAWGRRPKCLPGVTVLSLLLGSPAAEEEGFRSNTWISSIDGRDVSDLDDLRPLAVASSDTVATRAGRLPSLVVSIIDGDGLSYVRTLRPDPLFWPTVELRLAEHGWERHLWD
jgi:S1-C subfamily serine protease